MNEQEPKPEFDFPWQDLGDGEHIVLRDGSDTYGLYPFNTEIYLFPDYPHADYIFRWIRRDSANDSGTGFRLWRVSLDKAYGEGAFDELCRQMLNRGFEMSDQEEPDETDFTAYEGHFDEPLLPKKEQQSVDFIIEQAMKQFEAEWAYWSQEPGFGNSRGAVE